MDDDEEERATRIPLTCIDRIAASTLPVEAQPHGDTREVLSECAREFVQLVADAAQAQCARAGRRVVTGAHALDALDELGFGQYRASASVSATVLLAGTAAGGRESKPGVATARATAQPAKAAGGCGKRAGLHQLEGASSAHANVQKRIKHNQLSAEEHMALAAEQQELFAAALRDAE